jgi:hypothetical protein
MTILMTDKADSLGHLMDSLLEPCRHPVCGIDGMKLTQMLAGMFVETALLFDEADKGLEFVYDRLAGDLGCEPLEGLLGDLALPAPYNIDRETEQGRLITREVFIDWMHCPRDFMEIALFAAQQMIFAMEQDGVPRAESFRMLIECANRCLAYEIAAQELCDVVIDQKIGIEGWSLSESISGLSAVAGRSLALSFTNIQFAKLRGSDLPNYLDKIAHVMTQEAIRLGTPAGSDWRFGLAANDQPNSAPYELIASLEPICRDFFKVINLHGWTDQAVACAKAAGRMLALASGGERPEIEPVIAKPLAMAAMTETYKTVCREYAVG